MARYNPRDIPSSYGAIAALNANFDDIARLFDKALFLDGQTSNEVRGNLNLNHNKLRNLADATHGRDAVPFDQLVDLLATGSIGTSILFRQDTLGAVFRTYAAKVRETVSVADYGTTGDGSTDDIDAIMTCISENPNKRIVFPAGRYRISSPIHITEAPVTLDFSDRQATIVIGAANIDGIRIGDGTEATKNATINTLILAPLFNVADELTVPSVSGAAIHRDFTAFCHVYRPFIYGRNATTTILYEGVYDYKAQDCNTEEVFCQHVVTSVIHTKGDGTTPGRTVNCNYDKLTCTDFERGIFVDEGCAGLGFYRPTMYGIYDGGHGILIDCTPGPNGQNFFIDTPDIEAQPGATAAISLIRAQKTMISGGWVGASMNLGLRIHVGSDSCQVSNVSFNQSRVIVEGVHNTIDGGEIVGDNIAVTTGLSVRAAHTKISNLKIRQWVAYGIDWGGTAPPHAQLTNISFAGNGTDIEELVSQTLTIRSCSTDKLRNVAAAATANVPIPLDFVQITGATEISDIPLRGTGGRLVIQAGAGGITLVNSPTLSLPTSPLAVPAFQVIALECDGANYFKAV